MPVVTTLRPVPGPVLYLDYLGSVQSVFRPFLRRGNDVLKFSDCNAYQFSYVTVVNFSNESGGDSQVYETHWSPDRIRVGPVYVLDPAFWPYVPNGQNEAWMLEPIRTFLFQSWTFWGRNSESFGGRGFYNLTDTGYDFEFTYGYNTLPNGGGERVDGVISGHQSWYRRWQGPINPPYQITGVGRNRYEGKFRDSAGRDSNVQITVSDDEAAKALMSRIAGKSDAKWIGLDRIDWIDIFSEASPGVPLRPALWSPPAPEASVRELARITAKDESGRGSIRFDVPAPSETLKARIKDGTALENLPGALLRSLRSSAGKTASNWSKAKLRIRREHRRR